MINKKLMLVTMFSVIVFFLCVSPGYSAYNPAAGEEAGARMQKLAIIKGSPEGLSLNSEISRAELTTIMVRAFGKEEEAGLLKGSAMFSDIRNHWASGNIAMAMALIERAGGDTLGMPDGSFNPDGKLTPAQAVAFLMKFIGVRPDPAKAWPANYLDKAVESNIITAEDRALVAPMLNENATRGLVFYLFDRSFMNYRLPDGKTFYTKYVDQTAPVLTIDPAVISPYRVTLSGRVTDAVSLFCGSQTVPFGGDGKWTIDLPLNAGDNTYTFKAVDLVGNTTDRKEVIQFDAPVYNRYEIAFKNVESANSGEAAATPSAPLPPVLLPDVGSGSSAPGITVTPATTSVLAPEESVIVTFSKPLSQHGRQSVEDAVYGAAQGGALQFTWEENWWLMITNTDTNIDSVFLADVTADIADSAGNATSNAIIVDVSPAPGVETAMVEMDTLNVGSSKISALSHTGAISYKIKLQEAQFSAPLAGARPPGDAVDYAVGSSIDSTQVGYHLGIYAIDDKGKIMAFTDHILAANETW